MPLDYMLQVLRDPLSDPLSRMDAAKNAAPYVHARLAQTAITGPNGGSLTLKFDAEDKNA